MTTPLKGGLPPNLPPPPAPLTDAKALSKAEVQEKLKNLPPPPAIAKSVTLATGGVVQNSGQQNADKMLHSNPLSSNHTAIKLPLRDAPLPPPIAERPLPPVPNRAPPARSQQQQNTAKLETQAPKSEGTTPKYTSRFDKSNLPAPPTPPKEEPLPPNPLEKFGPPPAPPLEKAASSPARTDQLRIPMPGLAAKNIRSITGQNEKMNAKEFLARTEFARVPQPAAEKADRSFTTQANPKSTTDTLIKEAKNKAEFEVKKQEFQSNEKKYLEKANGGFESGQEILNHLQSTGIITRDELLILNKDFENLKSVVAQDGQNIQKNDYSNGAEIYKRHTDYKNDKTTSDASQIVNGKLKELQDLESQKAKIEGKIAELTEQKKTAIEDLETLAKGGFFTKRDYENWANKTNFGSSYPKGYVKSEKDTNFENAVNHLKDLESQLAANRKALSSVEDSSNRLGKKSALLKAYVEARSMVVEHRISTLSRTLESLAIHPGATKETAGPFIQGSKGFLEAVRNGNYLKARDEFISSEIANRNMLSRWSQSNVDTLFQSGRLSPSDYAFLKNYASIAEVIVPLLDNLIDQLQSKLSTAEAKDIPRILNEILVTDAPSMSPLRAIMLNVSLLAKDFDRANNLITPLSNELFKTSPSQEHSKVAKQLAETFGMSPVKRIMTYEGLVEGFIKIPVNSEASKETLKKVQAFAKSVATEMGELVGAYQSLEAKKEAQRNISTVSSRVTAFIGRFNIFNPIVTRAPPAA